MTKNKCISKEQWTQDEHKKYLWMHEELPIQVMIFTNDDEPSVKCLWIKTLSEGNYVSNYFIYSLENEDTHPLDYAIALVEKFKDSQKEEDDGADIPA